MTDATAARMTRRTVLVVTAGVFVAACDADGTPSAVSSASPAADQDVALALAAAAAVSVQLARAQAVSTRPRWTARVSVTAAAHAEHLQRLHDILPEETTMPTADAVIAPTGRAALTWLARGEDLLGRTLQDTALRAEDGAFARLLAGAAAGCAQLAVVLREGAAA